MSFEIVTDSSCNLPEDIIDRYGLHILSLRFLVGGKEYYSYTKGEITDLAQFYTMMRNKEEITTSQISSDTCTKLFESLLQDGKDVLYIGFSSALSGTYQVGYLALEELKKKYPERKIYAVDTLGASLGEGLLVYHAANLREAGESIEAVNGWLLENRLHLCHWFTVDDLFFLQRGHRGYFRHALKRQTRHAHGQRRPPDFCDQGARPQALSGRFGGTAGPDGHQPF